MQTTPRRRKARPTPKPIPDPKSLLPKLRDRLERERTALSRWQARMLRSFHAWEKETKLVARLERRISKLEQL